MSNTDNSILFKEAFKRMYESKAAALERNLSGGRADQGKRGELTSGKHLDGVLEALTSIIRSKFPDEELEITVTKCNLPGFYRPVKNWDMLIKYRGDLLCAIELKSIFSSYGNNANNRTEEALGTAVDFNDVLSDIITDKPREGAATIKLPTFGNIMEPPFTGFIFILPEDEETTADMSYSRRNSELFTIDSEFNLISYKKRFELACKRMKDSKKYMSTAVISVKDNDGNCDTHLVGNFIIDMESHIERIIKKHEGSVN